MCIEPLYNAVHQSMDLIITGSKDEPQEVFILSNMYGWYKNMTV